MAYFATTYAPNRSDLYQGQTSALSHQHSYFPESISRSSQSTSSSARLSRVIEPDRRGSHESKPRLSKDQQVILERYFKAQPKPSTGIKKDFSESLGVSREKVNNWFQNRRAKVKQDEKKKISANVMQYATQITQRNLYSEPQYLNPNFQHLPMDMMPRHQQSGPHGHHLQMPAEFAEPLMHGDIQPFGQVHQAVNMQFPIQNSEPVVNENGNFETFFGLNNSYGAYSDSYNHNELLQYSKQFDPTAGAIPTLPQPMPDMEAYCTSASDSVFTQSSHDESSQQLNHMKFDERLSNVPMAISNSNNPPYPSEPTPYGSNIAISRTESTQFGGNIVIPHPESQPMATHQGYTFDSSAQIPYRPVVERQFMEHNYMPEASLYNGMHPPAPPAQPKFSTPSPPQMQQQDAFTPQALLPSPPDEHQHPFRADSVISMPQESLSQLKEEELVQEVSILKLPSSGLSTRRPHRPAALGTVSTRSISFTANQPPPKHSPSIDNNHVRRIKSTGVMNGRIQKTGLGSAQRSPLGLNFPEGTTSPIGRQMSHQSLDAMALDSSFPVTPLSPMEAIRYDSIGEHAPETMHQATDDYGFISPAMPGSLHASPWPCTQQDPNTALTFATPSYASPPRTPRDFALPQQMGHTGNHNLQGMHSAPMYSPSTWQHPYDPNTFDNGQNRMHTPPQTTSQSFNQMHYEPANVFASNHGETMYQRATIDPGEDVLAMVRNSRRPNAIPTLNPAFYNQNSTAPIIHASADIPSGHSRQRAQQHSAAHMQPFDEISPTARVSTFSPIFSRSPNAVASKSSSELLIQQYSPREPADPSRLPPKSKSTTPKTFSFQHTGPEFYSP